MSYCGKRTITKTDKDFTVKNKLLEGISVGKTIVNCAKLDVKSIHKLLLLRFLSSQPFLVHF